MSTEMSPAKIYQRYRKLSLGTKILVFMVIGVIAGVVFGEKATVVQPLGDLFIRLLTMAAFPLIFFNLLAGMTSLTDVRRLGRISLKIFIYFFLTTAAAMILGIASMSLLKPGVGMKLTGQVEKNIGEIPKFTDIFLNLVPENIFQSFSSGLIIQVVVFAVLLGVAAILLPKSYREPLQKIFDVLARLFRQLVIVLMYFGPIGIGALMASTIGQYGTAVFGPLAVFIGGVYGAILLMIVIYMALLPLLARKSPFAFLKETAPLYATTTATCSSLASLTVGLEVAEERVKLPRSIYSFTLPLGAQLNKDGTAAMLAAVLVFTAQAAGIEFSLASLITVVLFGILLTTGVGGIPGGGIVMALMFVKAFQLPPEIAVIVGGIYRLIDMGITTSNIMGDMVGTVIVCHSEEA
ncbi:MAG: dicarboxylate/amino acid:cation symporter [Candidatus Aminicenantes bacterium]|nr:MAG: dicarboxylate/amino acid:cation symporter [Candidatus Aminicenantes bacterium]